MRLSEQLQEQRQTFLERVPSETVAVMDEATEELRQSGLTERALKEGDLIPDVTLVGSEGQPFALRSQLEEEFLILSFFRGDW